MYALNMTDDLRPFQIRLSDDMLLGVDNWRRKQTKIPSISEAIRQLIQKGLDADKAPRPRR